MPPVPLPITPPASPRIPRAGAALDANRRLRQALARLRRAIARHLALQTASWIVIFFVIWAAASFVLDYVVRLSVPQRGLVLAAGLALIGTVIYRWLIRPLRKTVRDDDLALVLENHFPQLEDRVITTLQLAAKTPGADQTSPQLLDAVAEEALAQVSRLSITEPLNNTRLRRRFLCGVAVAALFAAPWIFEPSRQYMKIWWQRNVLFIVSLQAANVEWPHQTYLKVFYLKNGEPIELTESNKVIRWARGDDLDILVVASGIRIPPHVRFDLRFAASGLLRETVDRAESDKFARKFFNVIEPFSFSVAGGDYQSILFSVEVVDPPELVALEIACQYPDYTALEPKKFAGNEGGLDAVAGTFITVTALANKPLNGGALWIGGARMAPLKLTPAAGGTRLEGKLQLTDPQQHTGMLRVRLTDAEGFTTDAFAYPVTTVPDRPPLVKVLTKGVSERITPNARVPLEIEASDDFGVRQTLLVHAAYAEAKDEAAQQKTTAVASAPADRKQFLHNFNWEIESLGLKPKEMLTFHAEAIDAVQGKGQSAAITLSVVKPEDLLKDIRRQFGLYAQELERMLKRQRDTTLVTRVSSDILQANQPNALAEEGPKLQEVLAQERDLGNTLQTLAEQFARLADEMENNRVGNPEEYAFWRERASAPIAAVSRQVLGALVSRLAEAQAAANSTAAFHKLQLAIKEQETVEATLQAIYAEIAPIIEFGPLVEELRRLLERARDNQQDIENLEKRLLEEWLKGGGAPK